MRQSSNEPPKIPRRARASKGTFRISPNGRLLRANSALANMLGYASSRELIKSLPDSNQLFVEPTKRQEFLEKLNHDGQITGFASRVWRKDGRVIWISESCRCVRSGDGQLLYYQGTIADISGRKQDEERLLRDALTGLPNRAVFMDKLNCAASRRDSGRYAVLFLDLDRFKLVNDSLGHEAGDQLLVNFVQRLAQWIRPTDSVARIAGDEFTILLEDLSGEDHARQIADDILHSLGSSFDVFGQEVFVTASIGIAMDGAHSRPADLLRDAATALHRAKALGKNRHQLFDAGLHMHAVQLLQMETDLRRAIERNEFELHYQPIIQIATGNVRTLEALIRWRHPLRGLIPPAEFIPIAEETGLITTIGHWVLGQACRQAAAWRREFAHHANVAVSINLSAKQFAHADLAEQIQAALRESGLPARCLILEITESVVMADADQTAAILHRLKNLGVQVEIDDFGTGYSSLAYLHKFPVDTMKIDRSFIARLNGTPENTEMVRTIITLAHTLSMAVTAEGVETEGQLALLAEMDCENSQGFLLSKPLPAAEATRILRSGRLRKSA
jgi:diguanylate cyclase (GGDEF)-like protein/PAS domain S-box-containing protein